MITKTFVVVIIHEDKRLGVFTKSVDGEDLPSCWVTVAEELKELNLNVVKIELDRGQEI